MSLSALSRIYSKLPLNDLIYLLELRGLATSGAPSELISRLSQDDLCRGCNVAHTASVPHPKPRSPGVDQTERRSSVSTIHASLPAELWTMILRYTNDWELTAALNLDSAGIRRPSVWDQASPLDLALLRCDENAVLLALTSSHHQVVLAKHVLEVILRFEYITLLDLLWSRTPSCLNLQQIPILASRYNRPKVLQWWQDNIPYGDKQYTESCLDAASSSGQIEALEWWKDSSLELKIGRVLDFASDEGNVNVLDWWLHSGLKFKYSKFAMRHASQNGHIDVLNWWLNSGLQLFYDAGCLDYATRFNRVAVLDWWAHCGLMIEYRIMDIEEALGEAVVAGNECRNWWVQQGIDFGVNNSEWMKDRILNEGGHYRHS